MGLVGGNLARSHGPAVVNVTVFGHTEAGKTLRRGGARAGDAIYVSGEIGASSAGFRLLQEGVALSPTGGVMGPDTLREGRSPSPSLVFGRISTHNRASRSERARSARPRPPLASTCRMG